MKVFWFVDEGDEIDELIIETWKIIKIWFLKIQNCDNNDGNGKDYFIFVSVSLILNLN